MYIFTAIGWHCEVLVHSFSINIVIKYEVIIYFIRATDSELKLWSTETGQCLRTFRGHVNEKNFVGLTVNNGYLSCGEFILTCNINV